MQHYDLVSQRSRQAVDESFKNFVQIINLSTLLIVYFCRFKTNFFSLIYRFIHFDVAAEMDLLQSTSDNTFPSENDDFVNCNISLSILFALFKLVK